MGWLFSNINYVWTVWVFAAQLGMLFPSLTLEQGIQNHSLSLEEGYILLHFESGTG